MAAACLALAALDARSPAAGRRTPSDCELPIYLIFTPPEQLAGALKRSRSVAGSVLAVEQRCLPYAKKTAYYND